jgi:hypothetical protein
MSISTVSSLLVTTVPSASDNRIDTPLTAELPEPRPNCVFALRTSRL